jgi:hypothetical protein
VRKTFFPAVASPLLYWAGTAVDCVGAFGNVPMTVYGVGVVVP